LKSNTYAIYKFEHGETRTNKLFGSTVRMSYSR